MVSKVTSDGAAIRIAVRRPWWRYIVALPFLAAVVFCFWVELIIGGSLISIDIADDTDEGAA